MNTIGNKRMWLIVASAVCLVALIAGGTVAYWSASETAHNTISMGVVEVALIEKGSDGKPFPKEGVQGVMPGDSVGKVVTAQNKGTADVFVRMAVTTKLTSAEGEEMPSDSVSIHYDTTSWTEKDGYFYYNTALSSGEETKPLFNGVDFALDMGNGFMDSTVQVIVTMQAVQSKNNDSAGPLGAIGWPEA